MCDVISVGPCRCSGSPGVSADEVLVVLGGVAAVGVGGAVVSTAPEFFAVAGLVMLAIAPNCTRRWLASGLRWLRREMWRTWTTRHQRPQPVAAPETSLVTAATGRGWHATLLVRTPAGLRVLTWGTVYGDWLNEAAVQDEVVHRARLAYTQRGESPPGELECRVQLAASL